MAYKTAPHHYYMVTTLVTYTREGTPKQRHMNLVLEQPKKPISMSIIDNARQGVLHRMRVEAGISPEDITMIVFLSFSYLGVMLPKDFYDMEPEQQPAEGAEPQTH